MELRLFFTLDRNTEMSEKEGRGEQVPLLPFICGSRESESAFFEMQRNPFLDINIIQLRSNK